MKYEIELKKLTILGFYLKQKRKIFYLLEILIYPRTNSVKSLHFLIKTKIL